MATGLLGVLLLRTRLNIGFRHALPIDCKTKPKKGAYVALHKATYAPAGKGCYACLAADGGRRGRRLGPEEPVLAQR